MSQRNVSNFFSRFSLLLLALLVLPACDSENAVTEPELTAGRYVYGVDASNNLIVFGALKPSVRVRKSAVTGLQSGETIVGIDFNAVDGKLYAVGSGSRIYTLDTLSGAATMVGSMAFTPALAGASFGVDFNPVADRLRTHSDADQNLRLNQLTGALGANDTVLAYMPGDANAGTSPTLSGTAYTNSIVGATTTALFAIDSERDILVRLPSPNSGMITTVGPLGVNTTAQVGFDIAGNDGMAYASLSPNQTGPSSFRTINLATGAATSVGAIFHDSPLVGIAVK